MHQLFSNLCFTFESKAIKENNTSGSYEICNSKKWPQLTHYCPHQLEIPKSYLIFFFLSAFINSKAKTGWTSLHYAAMKGYTKLVEYLIKKHNATIDSLTMVNDTLIDYFTFFSAKIKIPRHFQVTVKSRAVDRYTIQFWNFLAKGHS